jgi:hypothetical protein
MLRGSPCFNLLLPVSRAAVLTSLTRTFSIRNQLVNTDVFISAIADMATVRSVKQFCYEGHQTVFTLSSDKKIQQAFSQATLSTFYCFPSTMSLQEGRERKPGNLLTYPKLINSDPSKGLSF